MGPGIQENIAETMYYERNPASGGPQARLRGNLTGDCNGFRRAARPGLAMDALRMAVGRGGESGLRRGVEF